MYINGTTFFFLVQFLNLTSLNVICIYELSFHLLSACRYWVFRSWGRVGTTIGGNKLDKFHDKNSAMDNFLSVYKEKTGNEWGSSNFTKYPNKFYPLEIDYGQVHTGVQSSETHILQNAWCERFVCDVFRMRRQ